MKKLFERLFKKEPEFDYIIAEYQPIKVNRSRSEFSLNEIDASRIEDSDDMQIDKIYQRN